MKKYNLLYVDDEKHNLTAFRNVFGDEFNVLTASSAREAYLVLKQHPVDLVVADQRMPSETGVAFLARVRKEFPMAVRTIMTGYSDIEAVIGAINDSRIYHYFKKPWNERELRLVFKNAIEALELSRENSNLARDLCDALDEIRRKASELEEQLEYRQELIEKLEAANRVKSDFLSMISHELRTPLNPIIGYTDLMGRTVKEEPQRSFVSIVNRCGNDLLALIDGILEFLETEKASAARDTAPFDVTVLLKDLMMAGQSLLKEKGAVDIRSELRREGVAATALPLIRADVILVRQILHNLVANACKFTHRGEIVIEGDLGVAGEGHCLRFRVRDTGIGIAKENQASIFEAFTQVEQGDVRRFEGLGLGLALCRRQARMLKGRLSVESELGRGSVFTLELPVEVAEGDCGVAPEGAAARLGLRTLVVDDSEHNLHLMESMLKALACETTGFTDPRKALEELASDRYDVVFLDLLMPNISGFELAKRIREMKGEESPRLIAVTADLTGRASRAARESGLDCVLHKPLSLDALKNSLLKGQS